LEKIKSFLEKIVNRLEKKGVDDLTERDTQIGAAILLLQYTFLIIILFLLPIKLLTSIILTCIVLLSSGLFIFLMEKDHYNDKLMFVIGIIFIPIVLISLILTVKIVPYRGDDLMMLRKSKLKIITRKTKLKKLKFWKIY
jgi:hypothetical protein